MSQTTVFLIMNELLVAKKYDDCINVFKAYVENLESLRQNKSNHLKNKFITNTQKQPIPFGHLKLVAECLLCMNTQESFKMIKSVLFYNAVKFNSNLSNTAIACCFLLAINQVNPKTEKKTKNLISLPNRTS